MSEPVPSVDEWERDTPHAATPPCPACGALLGVLPDTLTDSGRREWWCDNCEGEGLKA